MQGIVCTEPSMPGSLVISARATLAVAGHRVAVLQLTSVLARERHVTLADADWLAAAVGAALAGAQGEVGEREGVAAGGALHVVHEEVVHAVLGVREHGLGRAGRTRLGAVAH